MKQRRLLKLRINVNFEDPGRVRRWNMFEPALAENWGRCRDTLGLALKFPLCSDLQNLFLPALGFIILSILSFVNKYKSHAHF